MNDESGFDSYLRRIMEKEYQILKSLGPDFDEESVPFWQKWGKPPIDKTTTNTIE